MRLTALALACIAATTPVALAQDAPDLADYVGHYVVVGNTEDGPYHGVAKVTLGPYPDRLQFIWFLDDPENAGFEDYMGTGVWKDGRLEVTFAGASSGVNTYDRLGDGVLEGSFAIDTEPQSGYERMIPVINLMTTLGPE